MKGMNTPIIIHSLTNTYVNVMNGYANKYRIHLETSSVLLRQLPVSALKRPVNWKYAPASMGTHLQRVKFNNKINSL